MAELVLSPLLQVIFDRLASPILRKVGDVCDLKDNFHDLQDALSTAQAVLEDAEEQQETNKAVKRWLSKLKNATYDAEDVLDKFAGNFMDSKVENLFSDLQSLERTKFIWISDEVRTTLEKLSSIAKEGSNLNLRQGSAVTGQTDRRETSSFVIESEVYGRKEDKEKIVQLLLSDERHVSFIPIIGIGGVGKTTLAQLAYNDAEVRQNFDVTVWVYVSDDFDVKRIMKLVIESATKETCGCFSMDVLQSRLWALLHNKKFLIVLDDVWTEDQEQWDKVESSFKVGMEGSKVIITTRNKKVAFFMSSPTFPYYLQGLHEDDCWKLFKCRAFPQGEDDKYQNLLPIGKEIVKKFAGIPLAAKSFGSFMRFKRVEREWLFVQNSGLWNLDVGKNEILPVLRLSYLHLPSHLKRCFAFCSIFPKGYEVNKVKLIRMWMAAGLINSEGAGRTSEDIGEEYFQDLLWMSFFQDAGNSDSSEIRGYKMHDIIHDLAQFVAGNEAFNSERHLPSCSLTETRHLSVVCGFQSAKVPDFLYEAKHLRTLILFPGCEVTEFNFNSESFPFLRVLDLSACSLSRIDAHDWFCLRYLDLSYTPIKSLYGAEKLLFLQTLNLCCCYNLQKLPVIAKMMSLIHLDVTGCERLISMFPIETRIHLLHMSGENGIMSKYLPGPSNQIRTLPTVMVGSFWDLVFLGPLNLQGELKIRCLEKVSKSDEAQNANLIEKKNLESLGLYWGNEGHHSHFYHKKKETESAIQKTKEHHSSGLESFENLERCQPDVTAAEEVINGLHPHQNLKKLHVEGYPGISFPRWRLSNLVDVCLTNFKNCKQLPVLGDLLFLETLSLQEMPAVKCIGRDFYGEFTEQPFPSLKELVLRDFPHLQEWSSVDGTNAFPSLTKLIVHNCPKLSAMPSTLSLRHFEMRDCKAVLFNSIIGLSLLKVLVIEKVADLLSLSGQFLANNPLLTYLDVTSCPKLQFLPLELGHLTALKSLKLCSCEELSCLPQGLQNLKNLESFEISDCHRIVSMPEDGIGGLKWLTALQHLSIQDCPELEERCKLEVGEDWPKIAHIPHKYIESPQVYSSAAGSSSA